MIPVPAEAVKNINIAVAVNNYQKLFDNFPVSN